MLCLLQRLCCSFGAPTSRCDPGLCLSLYLSPRDPSHGPGPYRVHDDPGHVLVLCLCRDPALGPSRGHRVPFHALDPSSFLRGLYPYLLYSALPLSHRHHHWHFRFHYRRRHRNQGDRQRQSERSCCIRYPDLCPCNELAGFGAR